MAHSDEDFDRAIIQLKQAFKSGKASLAEVTLVPKAELESTYQTGLQLLTMTKNNEAAKVLSALAVLEPYDFRIWRALGLALMRQKNFGLGETALNMALHLAPDDVIAHAYRGELMLLRKNTASAKRDLDFVIAHAQPAVSEQLPFIHRAKALLRFTEAAQA